MYKYSFYEILLCFTHPNIYFIYNNTELKFYSISRRNLYLIVGLVLMDNIKWLSFHSGYDFGYLLKLLTDQNLPQDENDFFESLRLYFPTVYDVKVCALI